MEMIGREIFAHLCPLLLTTLFLLNSIVIFCSELHNGSSLVDEWTRVLSLLLLSHILNLNIGASFGFYGEDDGWRTPCHWDGPNWTHNGMS